LLEVIGPISKHSILPRLVDYHAAPAVRRFTFCHLFSLPFNSPNGIIQIIRGSPHGGRDVIVLNLAARPSSRDLIVGNLFDLMRDRFDDVPESGVVVIRAYTRELAFSCARVLPRRGW
jgi:hypothetical protein